MARFVLTAGVLPPEAGGPGTHVLSLGAYLVARGHRVTVVAQVGMESGVRREAAGLDIVRIRRGKRFASRTLRSLASLVRHTTTADVVYATGLWLEAVLVSKLLGRPLVAKAVGDEAWERAVRRRWTTLSFEDFQRQPDQGIRIRLLKALGAATFRAASRCLVPSRYLAGVVAGWGVATERIAIIPNAVDELFCQAAPRPYDPEGPVLCVGRLVPWKRIDLVLDAVARVDGVRLEILGDGPQRADLEGRAREHGLASRVAFRGEVSKVQVLEGMQRASVLVLASTYEGLPHVLLEAMAAGVPVVATDVGGTRELVDHERTGLLIPANDGEAIRRAVERVLKDQTLAKRLIATARDVVLREYSPQVTLQKTAQLLESLCT